MQSQLDPATKSLRSPAFAAFYTQRLHELRVRLAYLCEQVWDVNAAWLVRRDVAVLIEQLDAQDPDADTTVWFALDTCLDAALAQPALPEAETRDEILALFRRIDMVVAAPEMRHSHVRQSANERIEVPPAAFWRRWTHDAPAPTYPEPDALEAGTEDAGGEFDIGHIDIDAMIAAGQVARPSLQIMQEAVAPHLAEVIDTPVRAGFEPPDEFIEPGEVVVASEGYDWDLGDTKTPASGARKTGPDLTLDAFWDATATTAPAPAPLAPQAPPAATSELEVPAQAVDSGLAQAAIPVVPAPTAPPPPPPPTPTPIPIPIPIPIAAPVVVLAAAPVAAQQPKLLSGAGQRIYHLTESDDLACELDQRLEQLAYELELLDSADELKEILGALTPHLVIVDTEFKSSLESIGAALRVARQRSSDPIRLLVLADNDTMDVRLAARRAGADSLLFDPQTSDEVIVRIEQILHTTEGARYRLLVVEDDRAQALFAQSILRNAGMEVEVVEDGLKVMEALRRFQPDLVLMDLHMPNCDGAELTALIREHDEFVNTPIVFLSGESDQDKHYEALSAGGDDFLSKPIRPKYLIATVNNRIQRARAVRLRNAQPAQPEPFDSGTGLHFRAAMLERLEQALFQSQPAQRSGGVLFVGVEDIPALRQRLGLTAVEELLEDVAQFIVAHMGAGAMACRYRDGCFLIFDAHSGPEQLRANAEQIRDVISFHPFETPKEIVALQLAVGVTDLRRPFADAAAVIDAAEHDSRASLPEPAPLPTPAPATPGSERAELIATLLSDAIEQDRLDLDYQPIVALQESGQAQYQTLLRLRRPDEADIPAGELLPVLRAQGRLPEFDRWVLQRALDVAAARLAIAKPVIFSVNQSIETLCQPDYADWLSTQLQRGGRAGGSLVIEVNIEEVGLNLEAVQEVCSNVLALGVRFCLSRYAGSSEQAGMLQVLPVDLVKIAPDLITQLGSNERRAAFGVLVEQLHERSIAVIAPRVEDTRTAALLWMSGIDYIQGNLVQFAGRSLDFDFNAAVL